MSELKKHITLPKNIDTGDDLDFSFLRKKGQEYIEQLAGNVWTDYNSHDPGITMLEMLCYAITDLGTRLQMPVENILSPENDSSAKIEDQFFKASQILPSKPVTVNDYRKLFIDIDGVKNCWLKPYEKTVWVDCKNGQLSYNLADFEDIHEDFKQQFNLKGLYSIIVDFDELDEEKFPTPELKGAEIERIKDKIRIIYHANRNLCEDLVEVTEVENHPISVCAKIEVLPDTDEELVHAKVLRAIDDYFSPSLKFYSLQQMLSKGYTTDEVFEGPLLSKGFVDPRELESAGLRTEVRLSDIMQLISDIEGVKVIKEISINDCKDPENEEDEWLICVQDGKKPVRCDQSVFSYYKSVLPVNVNDNKVKAYLKELEEAEKEEQARAAFNMEPEIPEGENFGTSETTTIQNDFPDTYGIGPNGLPKRAKTTRKSQAKQLKGYLLFFDQVFATYFAHLGKVKDLLSVDNQLKRTYFTQAVEDIKDFEELVKNYPAEDQETLTDQFLADLDNNVERKNKLLDHLIARFSEKFSDYAFLMKQLYGSYADKAVLLSKQAFLKDYDITSRQRGSAFNYFRQPESELWNTENVAGVQKRIARLIGMKNFNRRNLSDSFVEIYDLEDSDGETVYRWRIHNADDEIILSATENYPTIQLAENELYLSVLKIVETSPETIENAFKNEIVDEDEVGNFEIQVSEAGKYSFDVIDLDAPPTSTKRIISRQFTYYDTQDELKNALLEIIDFMANDFSEEGMFLVEHILLRPDVTADSPSMESFIPVCADDCNGCNPVDPYSFRVTVVLPGWVYRFASEEFRNYLEDLIRKEIPAHILARICWVGDRKNKVPDNKNDMLNFENAYRKFLVSKTNLEQAQNTSKLKNLIKALNELNSVYPTGKLIDCDDEDDELKGRIILGRTNIGNL